MDQRKPTQRHGAEVAAQMAKKDSAPAWECRKADSAPRWFALGGKGGRHGSGAPPCRLGGWLMSGRDLGQLRPDRLPVARSKSATCNQPFGDAFDLWAVFNWNTSMFPVSNRCHRDVQCLRQWISTPNQLTCGINRMFLHNFGLRRRIHNCRITRIVLLSQHHVFTQSVFNRIS